MSASKLAKYLAIPFSGLLLHLAYKRFIPQEMTISPGEIQSWKKSWEAGRIGWHEPNGNRWLASNIHLLTGGREKIRAFFPLCGKAVDMKCLADKGHNVVGVEVSPLALEQFFTENNIPYSVNPVPECNGSVYKSDDGKLQLYCCSIFDFNRKIGGVFDAIWDRGSMVALPPDALETYHQVMESLMAPGCQYFLERLVYPARSGPPHFVPMETIQKLFGDKCKIEVIDRFPSPEHKKCFNVDSFEIEIIRITPK